MVILNLGWGYFEKDVVILQECGYIEKDVVIHMYSMDVVIFSLSKS